MRIDQLGRPIPSAATRPRRASSGFSIPEDAAAPDSTAVSEAGAPDIQALAGATPAQASAAAQAAARRDREAAEHGDAMLATLKRLQLAALAPDGGQARADLAALAANPKSAADPGLNAVLQAIAARAAIEVARSG